MKQIRLKTGEILTISIEHPPFDDRCDWASLCWWTDFREQILSGSLQKLLYAPHAVGRIGGLMVGSICYFSPADTRDVGILEFVGTTEKHRRKGKQKRERRIL